MSSNLQLDPANSTKTDYHNNVDNLTYFEGDLNVTQEMFDVFYKTARSTRAIRRDRKMLWPEGTIYYAFHASVNAATRTMILGAMHEIEQETCLRFHPWMLNQADYIDFTGEGDRCLSSIGKTGGKQFIHLPKSCRNHGVVLHEIIHALGLWHEQSRPDRDSYVQVLADNIQSGKQQNFRTRKSIEVDSYGEMYDYGSIMHYGLNAFSGNNKPTLKVINTAEYVRQGQPKIGQRNHMSNSDIVQLNRRYNCLGSGVAGNLLVYVKNGHGLIDHYGDIMYVNITVVDDRKQHVTQTIHPDPETSQTEEGQAQEFYRWIEFGKRTSWQYVEISVWNKSDQYLSTELHTFSVNTGHRKNLQFCGDKKCSIRLYFAYTLTPPCDNNYNNCSIHHCIEKLSNSCQINNQRLLNTRIGYFSDYSEDEEQWLSSNLYIVMTAYSLDKNIKNLQTVTGHYSVINETVKWNSWLDFGVQSWIWFTLKVYVHNETTHNVELLCNLTTHSINYTNSLKHVKMSCLDGYLFYDYYFWYVGCTATFTQTNHQLASYSCSYVTIISILYMNNEENE